MNRLKKVLLTFTIAITITTNAYAKEAEKIDMMIYMKDDIHTTAREGSGGDPLKYIELLSSEAEKSQASLLTYLQGEEGVQDFESYYISNLINLKADKEVFEKLKNRDDIASIELNEEQEPSGGEIKELSGNLNSYNWNMDLMNISKAKKQFAVDGSGVTVGFIDSKANFNHPEISNNFRGNLGDGQIEEKDNYYDALGGQVTRFDHGTAVVSIAMGREDGQVAGIAPGAKWILARTFDEKNSSNDVILRAAEWMMAPGGDPSKRPDIINNSWGGKNNKEKWFEDILQSWSDLGIISVFATGNNFDEKPESSSIENPASLEGAFSVGAIDEFKKLCDFSKKGPSPINKGLVKPEVVAPGDSVLVASGENGYGDFRGTSGSAPHVTGVFALLKELKPDANIEHLKRAVIKSSEPLTSSEYPESPNFGFGYGLPKADKALELAENMRNVDRIKGTNRFETAVNLSKEYFTEGASTVYLANGTKYIDSLVMSILTNSSEGPLLLASEDSISDVTVKEIQRLDPENIVLIGGTNTLKDSLAERIEAELGIKVTRVAGENRFETSEKIVRTAGESMEFDEIYLVNGHKEADAISASGPAKYKNSPVLLTGSESLPDNIEKTIKDLKIRKITLVGGPSTISEGLEEYLINKGYEVDRKGGNDRYITSVMINEALYENPQSIILANGLTSVDALTAGPVAGSNEIPVLVTPSEKLPIVSQEFIKSTKINNVTILGGNNSISVDLEDQVLFD